jgi:aminopeptidase N
MKKLVTRSIYTTVALGISVALAIGVPGSSSLNDPLYPWMGNGGYDAQHYTIDLSVPADHKTIKGMSVMEAIATEDLSSFNLDLGTPEVKKVLVNGVRASFKHEDPELTITPATAITKGSSFRVQVVYVGTPGSEAQPNIIGDPSWVTTPSGVYFLSQPTALKDIAAVNDSAADKATFSFRLTAPQNEQAIANGIFLKRQDNKDGTATSYYRISEQTTSYMPTLAFGQYKRVDGGTVDGVHIRHYLAPNTDPNYQPVLAKTADMIRFFSERLGAYPFREYGIITHDVKAGFALENQTLSSFPGIFDGLEGAPPKVVTDTLEEIYAHELAHQWFGALVSYQDHSQTFIHEGFAQFFGHFWVEHSTGTKLADIIRDEYPYMLYAKDGGYFAFSKDELVGLLKQDLRIDPSFKFDSKQVGQALDLIFSNAIPSALRSKMLEKASAGLTITQLADEIAQLPFTKITVTRRINREVRRLADPKLETVKPIPAPGKIIKGDNPFNGIVYVRGSAALYALYLKVGDKTFFQTLRTYLEQHRFGLATNEDFLKAVNEVSGAEARALFERWLFDDVVPDFPELGLKAGDPQFALGADFKK